MSTTQLPFLSPPFRSTALFFFSAAISRLTVEIETSSFSFISSVIFSIIFSITAEPWRERLGESDGEIDIPICQLEFRLGEAAFFAEIEDVGDASAPLFTLNPGKSNPTKIAFAVPLGQLMRQCRNYLGVILFLTFPGASGPWYSQPCTKDGRQRCKALRRLWEP